MRVISFILLCTLLSACGQKGALYLPKPVHPATSAS
ncbi:MAG: lipoprotein [Tatlockia sp.]